MIILNKMFFWNLSWKFKIETVDLKTFFQYNPMSYAQRKNINT